MTELSTVPISLKVRGIANKSLAQSSCIQKEIIMINYHNKVFFPVSNSDNGEVDSDTRFHYLQQGNVLTCTYTSGRIVQGHLIALVDAQGHIDMRYHQVNDQGELMTGICHSTPELLPNGKIRLYERWQWTSGNGSKGESILEEID